jgi:hypothetical protein
MFRTYRCFAFVTYTHFRRASLASWITVSTFFHGIRLSVPKEIWTCYVARIYKITRFVVTIAYSTASSPKVLCAFSRSLRIPTFVVFRTAFPTSIEKFIWTVAKTKMFVFFTCVSSTTRMVYDSVVENCAIQTLYT